MRFASLKEVVGSLRFRLTLWNTAVVLVMILFSLWGVREGLRLVLWHEADSQLGEDAREIRLLIEQMYPRMQEAVYPELERKATTHTHHGFYVRLFDEHRQPLWASSNAQPLRFPTELFDRGTKPLTIEGFRLVHTLVDKPGIPRYGVRVGISLQPLEADVEQITSLMLTVGVIAMVISPLGGYWLAGRATRPIAEIIDTTNRLHPGKLDERLKLRGTRDELDRLSATINGFLDRIAEYIDQNREFTANAAHELRSPLAAIQNSLEVALNTDRTVGDYKELLDELLGECEHLRVLVNQLLVLAEGDAGRLQTGGTPVNLDLVVAKAADMFHGVAEAAGIDLRVACCDSVQVMGDSGRLRQVVNNLLDNAIKFTPSGGWVEIALSDSLENHTATLTVRDSGIGIAPADLPHVFDRFFRGDKSRHRGKPARGTGLGLAICDSIITAHNGRIAVESAIDRGTKFTIALPTLPVAAPPPPHDLPLVVRLS